MFLVIRGALAQDAHQLAGVFAVGKLRHHVARHRVQHVRRGPVDHVLRPARQPLSAVVADGLEALSGGDGLLHRMHALQKEQFGARALFAIAAQRLIELEYVVSRPQRSDLRHGESLSFCESTGL